PDLQHEVGQVTGGQEGGLLALEVGADGDEADDDGQRPQLTVPPALCAVLPQRAGRGRRAPPRPVRLTVPGEAACAWGLHVCHHAALLSAPVIAATTSSAEVPAWVKVATRRPSRSTMTRSAISN